MKAKEARTVAELTPRARRQCLEFAEKIAELAAVAPNDDCRRSLYGAVNRLRRTYGFSDTEKSDWLTNRIRLGASSIADLSRETGLDQSDVVRLLNDLVAAEVVRPYKQSVSVVGRPATLYFLNDGRD